MSAHCRVPVLERRARGPAGTKRHLCVPTREPPPEDATSFQKVVRIKEPDQLRSPLRLDGNVYPCQPAHGGVAADGLAQVEAVPATAGPAESRRLRQRAELIRVLLTPRRRSPPPP